MYSCSELKEFIDKCEGCTLSETRKSPVMGKGQCTTGIMFVAEAPGESEDRDGIPFTGRSGKVIDDLLNRFGLTREDVYITNIVKCHPPKNRNPLPEEQEQCIQYLRHEYAAIKPKVVVCLGRVAAQKMIRPDFKITKEHGEFTYKMGVPFTATYHPSAVLRDPNKIDDVAADFEKILAEAMKQA